MSNSNSLFANAEKTAPSKKKRIMVAGVGNIFMKDDGFGTEVIQRLIREKILEGVEVKDFGTGGLKLAYDLMKGYDALVLLDVSKRGEKPGTLYVIEVDEKEINEDLQASPIDPHGGDPATVLRFVKAIGSWPGKVLILACEPENTDEFGIGLSKDVGESVDGAITLLREIIDGIYLEENK